MKKVISMILSWIILSGLGVSAGAEKSKPPELFVESRGYEDGQYYVCNEEITISASVDDIIGLEMLYKGIVVYLDCNKDVIRYSGENLGKIENMVRYSETETGYMAQIIWTNPYEMSFYADFEMCIKDKGNPDVSVRAYIVTKDDKAEEMNISFELPENKVYEKIPHIVADFQPPVFDSYSITPHSGQIFVYAPQTADEISRMLSSSDANSVIKYLPIDDKVRENVISGDVFALEFEGKFCDAIYVYVIGDANSDGIITSSDAREVLRYTAKLENNIKHDSYTCDVNHDGDITVADARMILRVASKLDYFRLNDITVWQNQLRKVGPLVSASDGGYMWRCTVSEEGAIKVEEIIESSVDNTGKPPEEIIVGAPALQTFTLTPQKRGEFEVHFELIRPWEDEPIEEFGFTVVVDDVL